MKAYEDPSNPANGPEHHTGKACVEKGCTSPAGNAWSALWCQAHNAQRMGRIDANLNGANFAAGLQALGARIRRPSVGEGQGTK